MRTAVTDMPAPRLFADSADDAAVTALLRAGIVTGVTTNPTVLERDGARIGELAERYRLWVGAGAREVYFQTWGDTTDELLEHGRALAEHGDLVGVKVPATRAGFPAAAQLVASGTPVLVTAVYSAEQTLLAAAIGARYIAPYLGRLNDSGQDGVALIGRMAAVCAGSGTEVLAASLREPGQLTALRLAGVSSFTARPDVLWALADSAATSAAVTEFEAAISRIR